MRDDLSFTIRIGGIVLLTALVGLGVFLYLGSTAGVYALGIGIPSVIVAAAVVYARQSSPDAAQETSHYFEREAQNVGERMRTLLQQYDRLSDRLDGWDAAEIDDEITYMLDQFAEAGVEFDRATNRFTVSGPGDLREIERLDERIDEIRTELTNAAVRHVDQEADACRAAQEELRNAGLVSEIRDPPEPEATNPADLIGVIDGYDERLDEALTEAVDELGTLAAENDYSGDAVDRGEGAARAALDRGEYAEAAEVLVDTRAEIERDLSAGFEAQREELESLLDTVTSSVVTEYVSPTLVDDVETIQRELADIDSALELSDLEEISDRARDRCTAMVEEMSDTLDDCLDTLSTASVPDDFYEYQSANDEAYVGELDAASDLESFRRTWLTAVGELSSALDAVEEKAAIAEAYGPVSDDIEETLRKEGRVEPADLKVKQPGQFMELYAAETDGVVHEPTTPALVADDFGETYDVTVQAGFEEGGPERPVSVSLDGPTFSESKTLRTHLLDVVTFEDVPYGEYSLEVSTDEDGYAAIDREVAVEDNVEVEALLTEQPLRDSVCDGIEAGARDALEDAESLFADRFEEEEYLSAAMDLPMSEEYVPCMLALWAEEEGLTARRVDGDVLVYDGEQFANRLANIIEHNVSAGDSMSYEEIRNRYLSVPATKELITETIRRSDASTDVECGPRELTKH